MNDLSHAPAARKYLKVLLYIVIILFAFLAMVWTRAFYGSVESFRKGEFYLKTGQYVRAITFFDRSLHWYTPFNPYVKRSAEELWKISERAETEGNRKLALIAVRTIRRGFIAARSFYTPESDWIKQCDERIQGLPIIQEKQDSKPEELKLLNQPMLDNPQVRGPDVLWTIALLAGLLGWIGAVIGLIFSGFGPSRKAGLLHSANLKWPVLWVVSFAVWVFGMMKA